MGRKRTYRTVAYGHSSLPSHGLGVAGCTINEQE